MSNSDILSQLLNSGEIADTHCHLHYSDFRDEIDAVLQRAVGRGLREIWLVAVDRQSVSQNIEIVAEHQQKHPEIKLRLGAGLDMEALVPGSDLFNPYLFSLTEDELGQFVADFWRGVELELKQFDLQLDLVGEIGLDYYWLNKLDSLPHELSEDFDSVEAVVERSQTLQQILLESQLKYAALRQLPVSLHSRGAEQEVIATVKQIKKSSKSLSGVFHSFTGTLEGLTEIHTLEGFLVGINGIVTYKSATELLSAIRSKLQLNGELTIADLYEQGFVLETDAPYLVPSNAKRQELLKNKTGRHINEPSCVKSILQFLAK